MSADSRITDRARIGGGNHLFLSPCPPVLSGPADGEGAEAPGEKGFQSAENESLPPAAVPDASLPPGSPLPVVLRAGSGEEVWALHTLARKLSQVAAPGKSQAEDHKLPDSAGALYRFAVDAKGPVVVGTKETWRP